MAGMMERKQELEKELENALRILKVNKEKVSEELLMTKYKRSYEQLKHKIRELAEEYAKLYVLYGIRFRKREKRELASAINKAVKKSGLLVQISSAVYAHQDMQEMKELLNKLEKVVWDAAIPYMEPYGTAGTDVMEKDAA